MFNCKLMRTSQWPNCGLIIRRLFSANGFHVTKAILEHSKGKSKPISKTKFALKFGIFTRPCLKLHKPFILCTDLRRIICRNSVKLS